MGPKSYDKCPEKRREDTQGEGDVKTEAETGVMCLQAEERQGCRQPPEAGRHKEGCSLEVFRGSTALRTPWFQTSLLQNCERISFYCFKPPSL